MSFFGDDDFDSMIRDFFGDAKPRRRVSEDEFISGENEERTIDFIESENKFFVVFELPGYEKEDIHLDVKGNKLIVDVKKKISETMEDYMARKLSQGMQISKTLPQYIKPKKYSYTFSNGVLEVSFEK